MTCEQVVAGSSDRQVSNGLLAKDRWAVPLYYINDIGVLCLERVWLYVGSQRCSIVSFLLCVLVCLLICFVGTGSPPHELRNESPLIITRTQCTAS